MEMCPVCGPKGVVEKLDDEIRNCRTCKFMWNVTFPQGLLGMMAVDHVKAGHR